MRLRLAVTDVAFATREARATTLSLRASLERALPPSASFFDWVLLVLVTMIHGFVFFGVALLHRQRFANLLAFFHRPRSNFLARQDLHRSVLIRDGLRVLPVTVMACNLQPSGSTRLASIRTHQGRPSRLACERYGVQAGASGLRSVRMRPRKLQRCMCHRIVRSCCDALCSIGHSRWNKEFARLACHCMVCA